MNDEEDDPQDHGRSKMTSSCSSYPYDEKMYAQYSMIRSWRSQDQDPDQDAIPDPCPHLILTGGGVLLLRGSVVMVSSLSHCSKCVQIRNGQGEYVHVPRSHLDLDKKIPLLCYFCTEETNELDDVKEALKVSRVKKVNLKCNYSLYIRDVK